MAAKTKPVKPDEPQDQQAAMTIYRREREAEAALIVAKAAATVNKAKAVKPDHNGDIYQRMAALREDHVRMGVIPK